MKGKLSDELYVRPVKIDRFAVGSVGTHEITGKVDLICCIRQTMNWIVRRTAEGSVKKSILFGTVGKLDTNCQGAEGMKNCGTEFGCQVVPLDK